MERLTREGNFCEIYHCATTPGGFFCESGACESRKLWERLKEYEDADEAGRLRIVKAPPKGEYCGNCADFQRNPGHASGACRTQTTRRYIHNRGYVVSPRQVTQSRKACTEFRAVEKGGEP